MRTTDAAAPVAVPATAVAAPVAVPAIAVAVPDDVLEPVVLIDRARCHV
jgi:hypothetical protein